MLIKKDRDYLTTKPSVGDLNKTLEILRGGLDGSKPVLSDK